jgi:orotate phosphoribosyltransferase
MDGAVKISLIISMNNHLRDELLGTLARESYFERELTLASGRASNFYIDCKRTLYLPRGAYLAGELMIELVAAEGIEQTGGMAAGALPVTERSFKRRSGGITT